MNRYFSPGAAAAMACALCGPAAANILDDFNAGNIVADFRFDDAAGTPVPDLVNSGTVSAGFDSDADNDGVVANGAGQLDASGKANTAFGSNYVDLPTISSGRVIGLLDVSWAFDEQVYDPSQDEEFRLTIVRDDPRSTFVTAEIFFRRTSATEVTLFGNATGDGSGDTAETILPSSGDVLTLIDLDLDFDVFELWYSADDGASFVSAGTGTLDPARGVDSLRLVINEDFSDDSLLIDRFALATPEPTAILLSVIALAPLLRSRRDA